ncbi:MAG: hypothetical protein JW894_09965 [Bacteroidales bacterium]|nr:hypothetical protein [Bacteroidales bacterium]
MALPSFFRTYKNKQFNYIPIFYDKQKEELQERIRKIEKDMKVSTDNEYRPAIIKGSFRRERQRKVKESRSSIIRFVIILLILFVIVYYLLYK